ncbi:MAG TPA: hypothetical protein VFN62_11080 [Acidobacteriaceae bacterium]|nr:hypothetical protein [Acidobacteriaceae bacterium]
MNPRKRFTGMNKAVVVLGMALCVPAAMLAQGTPPPPQAPTGQQPGMGQRFMRHRHPPNPKRQLRHLTRMLNLTPDQQKQMLPILQDQHKRMESIHNNTALSPQDRRHQMRAAMMDTHQKLEGLMTDTQKQQFEQTMRQRRQRMRNGGMGMGDGMGVPPPPPAGQSAPVPSPR